MIRPENLQRWHELAEPCIRSAWGVIAYPDNVELRDKLRGLLAALNEAESAGLADDVPND